jgi:hypothetical protein
MSVSRKFIGDRFDEDRFWLGIGRRRFVSVSVWLWRWKRRGRGNGRAVFFATLRNYRLVALV